MSNKTEMILFAACIMGSILVSCLLLIELNHPAPEISYMGDPAILEFTKNGG